MRGVKVAPKYRGPEGETWEGRGATPRWLTALLKEGHSIKEFLIAEKGGKKTGAKKGRKAAAKKSARKRRTSRKLADYDSAYSVLVNDFGHRLTSKGRASRKCNSGCGGFAATAFRQLPGVSFVGIWRKASMLSEIETRGPATAFVGSDAVDKVGTVFARANDGSDCPGRGHLLNGTASST
jgi:H-NS histone C-terminal domain